MEKQKEGFTLVELLVVIAIIALLMGILMPALARVRQLAFRLTCGTNLSGIGKAMLIYANDYDNELPRAGTKKAIWDEVVWNAATRDIAYSNTGDSSQATISSCFYLLVKYAEVTPKSFICKGDTGTSEFQLSEEDPFVDPKLGFRVDRRLGFRLRAGHALQLLVSHSVFGLRLVGHERAWPGHRGRQEPVAR